MMNSIFSDPDLINTFYKFNPTLSFDDEGNEQVPDFPDDCLKFISDILLEEDLNASPTSALELTALEATEKGLYDALGLGDQSPDDVKSIKGARTRKKKKKRDITTTSSRKIQACFNDDYFEMEQYDDVILMCDNSSSNEEEKVCHGRPRSSKTDEEEEEVDLIALLTQCAQAVSSFDLRSASELLKQIRHHASPYGDSTQRLANHVANALEARIAGTGSTVSTNLVDAKFSASHFLNAYRLYVSAIPFKRMSFFLANTAISKLAETAKKIHIIDFGIFLGLQWPCLIQSLSKRETGPPQLRITGIDYPQQGFRPAQRVQATGHRLSGYCHRFGVPFKYKGIAQKWESIEPEDLELEKDELVIVNCMFRSGTQLDETVEANSPRDGFLALVKKLNPRVFIHGVVNGTFNAPFFLTRFREALFHYSSVFDVFEETIPREAHERILIESEVYGKEVFNVVACEGVERVQRPETYRQWQVRTTRAGLRQAGLDHEVVQKAKEMVKANYHKDFMVDVDRHWMIQGWKGRIFCALSFWQPP